MKSEQAEQMQSAFRSDLGNEIAAVDESCRQITSRVLGAFTLGHCLPKVVGY